MHCLLLGVIKKLIYCWVYGKSYYLKVKLSHALVVQLADKLVALKPFNPKEINRKPRELSELTRFKAMEFLTFWLYLGPLVLYNLIEIALFEHFLSIYVIMLADILYFQHKT